MKKIFYLLLLIISACSKDNDQSGQSQSNTELLINKKWKISAISGKLADGTIIADDYTGLPSYKKDNYFFFKSDLTFTDNANTEKKPGHPEDILDYGTWTLTNGDIYLNLISTMPQPPGSSITYFPIKILLLNSTTLKIESIDPSEGTIIWGTYIVIP